MRTLLTRRAGQPGTKKLRERWGDDLVCVRYRYDEARKERLKTIEIVIERVPWKARKRPLPDAEVRVKIGPQEDLLRRAVLFAGGRWDELTDTWLLTGEAAIALGLGGRILRHVRRGSPRLDRTAHTHRRSE